jgi:FkbM family methyltransferase
MNEAISIRVRGGGLVSVPASASYLSTYVLLEQEDWFEKEIAFARRFLGPGMRAIDVGANYGCYSVAMGRAVGPGGALWLYEPTAMTCAYLRRTLALNAITWAQAHQLALSDHAGSGLLSVGNNSELNTLEHRGDGAEVDEAVSLITLDQARLAHSIEAVDFVKLDAEGEEMRIVAGGKDFFRCEDPLVMFEVKHGAATNAELPGAFERLEYRIYRLVGPDALLIPVHANEQLDGFELNLFACKARRAERLAAAGHLIEVTDSMAESRPGAGLELWRRQPFASTIAAAVTTREPLYARSLDHYALWRDGTRAPKERYAALLSALRDLIELVGRAPSVSRLLTLARVAREAGARAVAVQALQRIVESLGRGARHELNEACWPALERYDALAPISGVGDLLSASAAEAHVVCASFSGYFTGPTALGLLDWLHRSGYASAPMDRRRELQALFAGRQRAVEGSPRLLQAAEDNLNPHLWAGGSTRDAWVG